MTRLNFLIISTVRYFLGRREYPVITRFFVQNRKIETWSPKVWSPKIFIFRAERKKKQVKNLSDSRLYFDLVTGVGGRLFFASTRMENASHTHSSTHTTQCFEPQQIKLQQSLTVGIVHSHTVARTPKMQIFVKTLTGMWLFFFSTTLRISSWKHGAWLLVWFAAAFL